MKYTLAEKQREWLESISRGSKRKWLYDMGYDSEVVSRVIRIRDSGGYDSFDKEILNEIRSYWLDKVGMRI